MSFEQELISICNATAAAKVEAAEAAEAARSEVDRAVLLGFEEWTAALAAANAAQEKAGRAMAVAHKARMSLIRWYTADTTTSSFILSAQWAAEDRRMKH